jgi:hypothetical protein
MCPPWIARRTGPLGVSGGSPGLLGWASVLIFNFAMKLNHLSMLCMASRERPVEVAYERCERSQLRGWPFIAW